MVSIIILNWKKPQETLACLKSLAQSDATNVQVIVVDNASDDDSVSLIRRRHPEVVVLETASNLGYAGGNNFGIRYALARDADLIGILNNDVTVGADFLSPLLVALTSRPDVGVVTPLVVEQSDDRSHVWALGSSVDQSTSAVSRNYAGEPMTLRQRKPPFEVEVASGAAMLVKREVFEKVGLIDEDFFLYFEEVDWSLAVRKNGFHIFAVPSSVVWHDVSATLGTASPVIDYYMLRNHLRLIGRHWTGVRRSYLWSLVVLRNLLAIAAFTLKPHGRQRIPNRNARLFALRDAVLGRWGKMGPDVSKSCHLEQ